MAKYAIFVRKQEQEKPGKGAARGDIVSMRPVDDKITDWERKHFGIYKRELTDKELVQLQDDIRPLVAAERENAKLSPNSDPDDCLAIMNTFKKTNPNWGVKIDFNDPVLGLTTQQKEKSLSLTEKSDIVDIDGKDVIKKKSKIIGKAI